MAKQYQPSVPFNVPFKILSATLNKVNGVNVITYPTENEVEEVYFCNAKAYIGVSKNINDLSVEEDTLTIDSYWIPTLKKNDRIILLDDNSVWELLLHPENISCRNQYSRFKVVRVRG